MFATQPTKPKTAAARATAGLKADSLDRTRYEDALGVVMGRREEPADGDELFGDSAGGRDDPAVGLPSKAKERGAMPTTMVSQGANLFR